jgi:hypothetical protein
MIQGVMALWFILTALSVSFVVYDLIVNTPAMGVMKIGWILVILYTGPVGLFIYFLSCREPLPYTHERFVAPLWKQSVGSTIHCLAGDATGIILVAVTVSRLGLPRSIEIAVEYAGGFIFGLFIFQALFMKGMIGGGYLTAVRRTVLPEWLSMNCIMAGMIPVMVALMGRVPGAEEPSRAGFWWVMSMASIVGGAVAFPVNRWLVSNGMKHGMGTVRAIGRGGHSMEMEMSEQDLHTGEQVQHKTMRQTGRVSVTRIAIMTASTLLMLVIGALIAFLLSRATRGNL